MSVNQMDTYYATCDWRGCPTTLENLTESDMKNALIDGGWEIDGSLFNGAPTYCPEHAEVDGDHDD